MKTFTLSSRQGLRASLIYFYRQNIYSRNMKALPELVFLSLDFSGGDTQCRNNFNTMNKFSIGRAYPHERLKIFPDQNPQSLLLPMGHDIQGAMQMIERLNKQNQALNRKIIELLKENSQLKQAREDQANKSKAVRSRLSNSPEPVRSSYNQVEVRYGANPVSKNKTSTLIEQLSESKFRRRTITESQESSRRQKRTKGVEVTQESKIKNPNPEQGKKTASKLHTKDNSPYMTGELGSMHILSVPVSSNKGRSERHLAGYMVRDLLS